MSNITKTIMDSLEGFDKLEGKEIKVYSKEDWEKTKSHLLQSQIKVVEAVIEEMKKEVKNLYSLIATSEGNMTTYNFIPSAKINALEDQISSLNETLEELKKSL